jgi:transposase
VSLLARQHGIAPNQVFTWRRLYAEGALSAVEAGEEVVPASEYRGVAAPSTRTTTAARQEDLGEVLRYALELAPRLDRPHKGNDRIEIGGVISAYQL